MPPRGVRGDPLRHGPARCRGPAGYPAAAGTSAGTGAGSPADRRRGAGRPAALRPRGARRTRGGAPGQPLPGNDLRVAQEPPPATRGALARASRPAPGPVASSVHQIPHSRIGRHVGRGSERPRRQGHYPRTPGLAVLAQAIRVPPAALGAGAGHRRRERGVLDLADGPLRFSVPGMTDIWKARQPASSGRCPPCMSPERCGWRWLPGSW